MEQVAILGLGLMGGSLGLALRKPGTRWRVRAYARREETRRRALEIGACDEVFSAPEAAAREASLVVICVPVRASLDLLAACAPVLGEGAVVTDVGSTKRWIMERAPQFLAASRATFVGSHPMAGSERDGLDAARADLYRNAVVAVTPGNAPAQAVIKVSAFWRDLGAQVCLLDPETHDRLVARTSHLPHVAAALLADVVGREGVMESLARLTGRGFADTTRVAQGPPSVWRDVLETNADMVLRELTVFEERLASVKKALETGDFNAVEEILTRARLRRQALLEARYGTGEGEQR